jgi:cobalt-zinc-cadmium efflux system outer membrane protein
MLVALLLSPGTGSEPLNQPARLAAMRQFEFSRRSFDDPSLLEFVRRALQHHPGPESWDLDRLILAALFYSPELDIVRARIEAAEAAIQTANTTPNPKLSFGLGFPFLISLSLQLPADTAALRGLRTHKAEFLSQSTRYEFYEAVWSLRSRVRAALLLVYQLEQTEVLDALELDLRNSLLQWAQQRFKVGEFGRQELEPYRLAYHRIQALQSQTLARRREAQGAAAQLLGVPLPVFKALPWSPQAFQEPIQLPPQDALQLQCVIQRPDLQQALSDYRAALADLRLEGQKADPIFQLGPGYQLDQAVNKFSLGFSLPLPISDFNQGPIAERLARAKELESRFNLLQDRALIQLDQAYGALKSSEIAYCSAQELVASSRCLESGALRQLLQGESDRSQFLQSRLETVLAGRARLDSLTAYQRQLGLLEDALHNPLQGQLRSEVP